MLELHEIVHTAVARIICGCWGVRDFNAWNVCEGCETNPWAWLSTLAGPVFTFVMIWVGCSFLKSTATNEQKSLGMALVFANTPFGRLLNPMLRSGDEVTILSKVVTNLNVASVLTFVLILLITFYPLYRGYKTIENKPLAYFLLFFLAPVVTIIVVLLVVLNTLLAKGILAETGVLGSPILVNVWSALVVLVLFVFRKHLLRLGEPETTMEK